MCEVLGVYRTVAYRVTFEERNGEALWQGSFVYQGQMRQVSGTVGKAWSPLPTMKSRVNNAVQLCIESALLRESPMDSSR